MAILYSPATGGFYDTAFEYADGLPADGVEITADQHVRLLTGAASGQVIALQDGVPALAPRTPTRAQLVQAIKAEAARRIELIAPLWRQLNDTRNPTPESAARFAAIDAIRTASNLIEQDLAETDTPGLPAFPITDHPLWPEASQTESD